MNEAMISPIRLGDFKRIKNFSNKSLTRMTRADLAQVFVSFDFSIHLIVLRRCSNINFEGNVAMATAHTFVSYQTEARQNIKRHTEDPDRAILLYSLHIQAYLKPDTLRERSRLCERSKNSSGS